MTVTMTDATQGIVLARAELCVSYQPEELDTICLLRHGTEPGCTPCTVPAHSSGRRSGIPPQKHEVLKIVGKKIKGARMRGTYGSGAVLGAMEMKCSIYRTVKALAASAGSGSECHLLYRIFIFDRLYVRYPERLCSTCVSHFSGLYVLILRVTCFFV